MSAGAGETAAPGGGPRVGVLLCNLGTPDAPDARAVRRFLAQFLSDPRVVELPRLLWWPLLHGVILNLRPRRSAHAYGAIWTAEGSPLLVHTQRLAKAVQARLQDAHGEAVTVALGMRYGEPTIAGALAQLVRAQARHILVLPLYPQYAAATTASAHDAVFAWCERVRWLPALRFITDYHADAGYIRALALAVRSHWASHGRSERLLISFHGIPRAAALAGDPYHAQCLATARHLAAALELEEDTWQASFQSRIGFRRWLEPYTGTTLQAMARAGIKTVDVVCPGFATDCLETLEEIALREAQRFRDAGGAELRYVPALNDAAAHAEALAALVTSHLGGWLPGRVDATLPAAAAR